MREISMKTCSRILAMCLVWFGLVSAANGQLIQPAGPTGLESGTGGPIAGTLYSQYPGRVWLKVNVADQGLGYRPGRPFRHVFRQRQIALRSRRSGRSWTNCLALAASCPENTSDFWDAGERQRHWRELRRARLSLPK